MINNFRNLVFLLFLFSFNAQAQNTEPDHLNLHARFEGEKLTIDARYTAKVKKAGRSLLFLLNPGFAIQDISGPGLDTFYVSRRPDRPIPFWKLSFLRELREGETVEVLFSYSIDLVEQNHLNSGWIELNTDKFWFPNHDDIDNEFTYEVTVTGAPENFTPVGHMNAKVEVNNDGDWSIRMEKPAQEVLILAGRNMKFWQPEGGSFITFFAHRETPDSLLVSMHDKVEKSIDLMTRTFGSAQPIDTYRVVLRNTPRKELGFQFARENMIVTGPDFNSFGNLSHEVAHYWWDGADFIREPWMNESFANYSMFLVMEAYDPADYKKTIEKYREIAGGAPPVGQATVFSEDAYDAYYIKGSVLLKELEAMIGRAGMEKLLTARVEKEIDTTEGFLRELERVADREIRDRFEQMLGE